MEGTSGAVRRVGFREATRSGGPKALASLGATARGELIFTNRRTGLSARSLPSNSLFQSWVVSVSDKRCLGQAGWGKSTSARMLTRSFQRRS